MRLRFSGKTSDLCSYALLDEKGETIHTAQGYVPSDLGIGGGDYVQFELDLATGQLVNFKPVTDIDAKEAVGLG